MVQIEAPTEFEQGLITSSATSAQVSDKHLSKSCVFHTQNINAKKKGKICLKQNQIFYVTAI